MEVWQTLLSTAVLGTDRQPLALPAVDGPLGAMLARLQGGDDDAHTLLSAAAAVALFRRVGAVPAQEDAPLPELCAAETRPPCPARLRELLLFIINGTYPEVFAEWVMRVDTTGYHAPDSALPALLQAGKKAVSVHAPLTRIAGARGQWLARQNPQWHYLLGEADVEDIAGEDAPLEARAARVRRVRASDPAEGRALVVQALKDKDGKVRTALLAALATGLCADDEPLLERALDDRRKEVREVAIELLAQLPDSAFTTRMIARVSAALSFTSPQPMRLFPPSPGVKAKIEVTLPNAGDKAMQRDGIQEEIPTEIKYGVNRIGEKSWLLLQMMALIRPGYWCTAWGLTPEALVELVKGHEWREPLLRGWLQGVVRFHDDAFARALLPLALADDSLAPLCAPVLRILPQDYWEETFILALQGKGREGASATAVLGLLPHYPFTWNTALSTAVAGVLQQLLSNPKILQESYWSGNGQRLQELLNLFARHAATAALAEGLAFVQRGQQMIPDSSYEGHWTTVFAKAIGLMQFRQQVAAG